MIILDTNIIIDHLRTQGIKESVLMKFAENNLKEEMAISIVSIQELYEGQSTLDERKEEYLLATITPLKILPYTYEVAQLAGEIARDLKNPIEFTDAAIAATSILYGTSLWTLNKKHFLGIKNLELIER